MISAFKNHKWVPFELIQKSKIFENVRSYGQKAKQIRHSKKTNGSINCWNNPLTNRGKGFEKLEQYPDKKKKVCIKYGVKIICHLYTYKKSAPFIFVCFIAEPK